MEGVLLLILCVGKPGNNGCFILILNVYIYLIHLVYFYFFSLIKTGESL